MDCSYRLMSMNRFFKLCNNLFRIEMKQLSTEQVQIITSQCHRRPHVMHAIIFTIHRRLQEKIWVIHTDLAIDYLNMHAWFSFITDNARLTTYT